MQLTQFTDYALRALIYMAVKNDNCTITEIAESYQISRNHLVKIVHKLGQLGYIKTIRGNKGGIHLNHPPTSINIGELVKQTEPNFHLVECFDKEKGTCCIIPVCQLKQILHQAQQEFLDNLHQYTLADITSNKAELAKKLRIL